MPYLHTMTFYIIIITSAYLLGQKKRLIDFAYHAQWSVGYFIIDCKILCLLCNDTIAKPKEYNISWRPAQYLLS